MGDWTGLVTAIALLVTAVGTVFTALGTLRNRTAIKENTVAVGEVHTLVNNRSEKQDIRIEQLTKVIEGSLDSEVPDRIVES